METIDWKMISVCFSVLQFIFTAVIFSVIKFNDLKHLDMDFKELKKEIKDYETKNDERHLQNVTAINSLSNTVSNLAGRCEAFHNKI